MISDILEMCIVILYIARNRNEISDTVLFRDGEHCAESCDP